MLHRMARLGLVLAVMAGSALFTTLDTRVTLVVDGRPLEVRTASLSVGQLLARRGLALGPHDEVRPAVGTRLRDGLRVVVNRAPLLTLVVHGRSRMLPVPEGTPSIRDALAHASVELDSNDVVTPGLGLRPRTGMTVRVTRVTYRRFSQVEIVPFATRTRYDPSMKVGTSQVERGGHDGHELVRYEVRMEDGREVRRDASARRCSSSPGTPRWSSGPTPASASPRGRRARRPGTSATGSGPRTGGSPRERRSR